MRSYQRLQQRRIDIAGKIVVGIDPAKDKHQAVVLDPIGLQLGSPFTFPTSHAGYTKKLWDKLGDQVADFGSGDIVFAIENSCNLWQTLSFYLDQAGWAVKLVSPLSTKNSRSSANNDPSKTDPKDALLIGSNSQQGYYSSYQRYSDKAEAMHRLGITYDKLRKDYVRQRNRLRALLDFYFPEFPRILSLSTKTALHLLQNYQLPPDFLQMDIERVTEDIARISRQRHGRATLLKLQEAAKTTIGVCCRDVEALAIRLEFRCWLARIELIEQQMEAVFKQLRLLAAELPQFDILTGLKGISDTLASLYLAELRDPDQYRHYKQIEKAAGYNLVMSDSGRGSGVRHISPIGNKRLRWILYRMAEETLRYVPEVRLKYLRRQTKKSCYRQSVVATIPVLLKLIVALCKRNGPYEYRSETQARLKTAEAQYEIVKAKRSRSKK